MPRKTEKPSPCSPEVVQTANEIIDVVINGLVLGKTERQIVNKVGAKFGLSDEAVCKVIGQAKRELSELYALSIKDHFHRTLTRLETLWQRTYESGDYSGALAVQKTVIGLLGLEAPKELHISGSVQSNSISLEIDQSRLQQLPLIERRALLEALTALAPEKTEP